MLSRSTIRYETAIINRLWLWIIFIYLSTEKENFDLSENVSHIQAFKFSWLFRLDHGVYQRIFFFSLFYLLISFVIHLLLVWSNHSIAVRIYASQSQRQFINVVHINRLLTTGFIQHSLEMNLLSSLRITPPYKLYRLCMLFNAPTKLQSY